ncbi:MAG: adenosylcobinamide-GDP ribazoletransferase [Dermatophilaceae bacterium]
MSDALRLAFGTLTAIRVAAPSRIDPSVAGAAMLLAPVAALPFAGAVLLAHVVVADLAAGPWLVAALLLALLALGTRGLHWDGLADTTDALAAGYDRDRSLAVMRRSDVGPAGVCAVMLVLLVQASALAVLLATPGGTALAAAGILASRHTLAWLCRVGVAPARPDGLGAAVAGTVPTWAAACVGAVLALGSALGAAWCGARWYAGPLVVVVAVGSALVLASRATARFGGITGDVLGAAVEVGLAAALACASVLV